MDIVFQFGEFTGEDSSFWSDLLIQLSGAIIGAVVAVWLFFRQIKSQKDKEEADKIQLHKDRLQYLDFLLKDATLLIDRLVNSLELFSTSVKKDPSILPRLGMVSIDVFYRIGVKIDQEHYFHAYKALSKNEDDVSKMFSITDFYHGTLTDLRESYRKVADYDYERRKIFGQTIMQLVDSMANALKLLGKGKPEYDIVNDGIFMYYASLNPDPSDFISIRDNFLSPFSGRVVKYKNTSELSDVITIVSKANKLLDPIIRSNMQYASELDAMAETLKKSNEKLKHLVYNSQ